jgi:hypothetical protein
MPQVSIYLDRETFRKVRAAARKERCSLSRWARRRLSTSLGGWPDGYFDVFGALADMPLKRPPQGSFDRDVRRMPL